MCRKTCIFGEKKDLWLISIQANALNRSNNRDCSVRAHLYLRYHLIYVPWSTRIPVRVEFRWVYQSLPRPPINFFDPQASKQILCLNIRVWRRIRIQVILPFPGLDPKGQGSGFFLLFFPDPGSYLSAKSGYLSLILDPFNTKFGYSLIPGIFSLVSWFLSFCYSDPDPTFVSHVRSPITLLCMDLDPFRPKVLILDGNLELGVHRRSNPGYLIC